MKYNPQIFHNAEKVMEYIPHLKGKFHQKFYG